MASVSENQQKMAASTRLVGATQSNLIALTSASPCILHVLQLIDMSAQLLGLAL